MSKGMNLGDTFQFTHPVRGATFEGLSKAFDPEQFQFTHPVRGATDVEYALAIVGLVSIHAPREGCDFQDRITSLQSNVSIHAPREGCDLALVSGKSMDLGFQFTHPVRGATCSASLRSASQGFQFTHPVRGATAYIW